MIPEEIIREVQERVDLVALIGRSVDLRKAGTLYKACCPFHEEKTPSFTVSPGRNSYHCFGCEAHGDAIRFLMEHQDLSFPEALRTLAAEVGVEIPEARPETPAQKQAREQQKTEQEQLFALQDSITSFFSDELRSPGAEIARRYLEARGIGRESAEAFRLGWASGDKLQFERFCREREIWREGLVKLGLLIPPEEGWSQALPLGGGYLRFRERLMFPILDRRAEVTGFSARTLYSDRKIAKYLNSPETPIFTKGEQLYGAHTARHSARRAGRLILCEGNIDVISLWQAGFKGSVAAMGTALSSKQVRLAKRLSEQVICVMDGDAAGQKAAFASLLPFLEEGMQPRAVMLPQGADPDSFLKVHGSQEFERLLDGAKPLFDLFIQRSIQKHPDDPPGRVKALREIIKAFELLQNPLEQGIYRQQLRERLQLDDRLIDEALRESRGAAAQGPQQVQRPWRAEYTGSAPLPRRVQVQESSGKLNVAEIMLQPIAYIMLFPAAVTLLEPSLWQDHLTHEGLAAFVSSLYAEVEAGKLPNIDQMLNNLTDPNLSGFLWERRSSMNSLEEAQIRPFFAQVSRSLKKRGLERKRQEVIAEILKNPDNFGPRATPDDSESQARYRTQFEAVQKQLRAPNPSQAEGTD